MPGVAVGDFAGASGVMVDWEDEREKVLARGARWVSLSFFVSFQDMVMEFPDH